MVSKVTALAAARELAEQGHPVTARNLSSWLEIPREEAAISLLRCVRAHFMRRCEVPTSSPFANAYEYGFTERGWDRLAWYEDLI